MIILSHGASSLFPTTGRYSWAEEDCSVFARQYGAEDAVPPPHSSQASLWEATSYAIDLSDRSLINLFLRLLTHFGSGGFQWPREQELKEGEHGVHIDPVQTEAGAGTERESHCCSGRSRVPVACALSQ